VFTGNGSITQIFGALVQKCIDFICMTSTESQERIMTKKEAQTDKAQKSVLPTLSPSEFAAIGKERLKQVAEMQSELFATLQELNRHWLDRMQSEATLASEIATKLTTARSIPESVMVYQEWTSRRLEIMAEDGKHLLGDAQKFMETSARLLSDGSRVPDDDGGIST
jgi:hypothetical protein